jgi:predicted dehydrogenase
MIRTLVTGYGHWGSIIAANLLQHSGFFLAAIHDPDTARLNTAAGKNIHAYRYLEEAIEKTHPELVCVCTPISSIAETACRILTRYTHAMSCKPGAIDMAEYERITSTADKYKRAYIIDYTTLAAPSFRRLKARLAGQRITSIEAIRFATQPRSTADIIDDLIVHDAAMISELIDTTEPGFTAATRTATRADMQFTADGASVRITADRAANSTARVMRIATQAGTYTYDQVAEHGAPTPVMARLDWVAANLRDPSAIMRHREVAQRILTLTDRMKVEAA